MSFLPFPPNYLQPPRKRSLTVINVATAKIKMTPRSVNKDDVHRLFLQAVMSRRHVAEGVARGIWKACNEAVSGM